MPRSYLALVGSYDQNKNIPDFSVKNWTRWKRLQSVKTHSVGHIVKKELESVLFFSLKVPLRRKDPSVALGGGASFEFAKLCKK